MESVFCGALILSLGLLPTIFTASVARIAEAQTQPSQSEVLQQLLEQARQQAERGESQRAI
jgi:hypothetical protein